MGSNTWRIVIGALACVLLVIRLYFHLTSRTWDLGKAKLGPVFVAQLALTVPALASLILFIVYPSAVTWASLPIPDRLRLLGVALLVFGMFLLIWIQYTLGKNFSPLVRIRDDQSLVTGGPYRYVRHPMYTVISLMSVGMLIGTANWLIGASWILTIALVMLFRTTIEEQSLIDAFGPRYIEYMRDTPRFLPRLFTRTSRPGYRRHPLL